MQQSASPDAMQSIDPFYGQLGHLLVIMAFVFAFAAALLYLLSVQRKDAALSQKTARLARMFFFGHVLSIIGIVITLFLLIFNHHFEYEYVWAHSSRDLQMKYILSCFWEGQEGSFLLWSFWHVVLGLTVIFFSKKWEGPVMTIISVMQVFLLSFLLGIYIGDTRIGVSPFILLKDAMGSDPVFLFDNYMRFIPDGRGLNALLQNYWMVIHPPVLFCGFASITLPFAYGLAGLWKRDYTGWLKPAIPYALFSGMVLGTGILMGGAWAYESLSFGGFWAWDPVENASLIPWLIMVAALHNLVVARSTGHALRSSYIMISLAFFFVIYASFLTRSGILGDTSVHAFVEEGLTVHLLVFLAAAFLAGLVPLFRHWRFIPTQESEEKINSREFWMFVGSLILLFGGLHVIFFTSIPVYNKLFGFNLSSPTDPVHFYTGVQIWVGMLIALLSAFGQFLKYKKTEARSFFRSLTVTFIFSVVAAVISVLLLEKIWHVTEGRNIFRTVSLYTLLLICAWFSVIANTQYIIRFLKGRLRVAGGSIAHIGFAILLLGILISNAGQKVISENVFGVQFTDGGEGMDNTFQRENVRLIRNAPLPLGDYLVTYLGDTVEGGATYFNIHFLKSDPETHATLQEFTVHPYLLMDNKMQQLAPNPDTKHFLTYDVFTHVSSIPSESARNAMPELHVDTIRVGDTIHTNTGYMVLENVQRYVGSSDSIGAGAQFTAHVGKASESIQPVFAMSISDNGIHQELSEIAHCRCAGTF
ncbi:MAG: cytochrome c biogenesis protein CcsA [Chitinophagales bacterium]